MRSITGALILVLLIAAVGSAAVSDIVGYVFYQDWDTEPIPSTSAAYPVNGASVTLYKRSTSSPTGWEVFDSSGVTDSDGYYIFEDINVGNSLNGLCTHSDWFRIEVDATNCLPEDWEYLVILDRFSHNEIRPGRIPDPGTIRIDVVYSDKNYVPNSGPPVSINRIEGHFTVEHELGFYYSPDDQHTNWGTCPIGSNRVQGGGCISGHWQNMLAVSYWNSLSLSAYSEFIFTYGFVSQPFVEIGRGYFYYSYRWPSWATHIEGSLDKLVRDFVYHLPEPSQPENSNSTFDCSGTGNLEAVQVWPNPSSSSANLSFSVTESCDIELSLFDLSGRLLSVLAQGIHVAGEYTIQTGNLSSGIYLCRFKAGTSVSTTRVLIE